MSLNEFEISANLKNFLQSDVCFTLSPMGLRLVKLNAAMVTEKKRLRKLKAESER